MRRRTIAVLLAVTCLAAVAACGDDDSGAPEPAATTVVQTTPPPSTTAPTTTRAAGDGDVELTSTEMVRDLDQPVAMTAVPGREEMLVVEQAGRLLRARIVGDRFEVDAEPVLDLTDRIESRGNEQGLLGVAVSPDGTMLVLAGTFRDADHRGGMSRVIRWAMTDGVLDPASETVLLSQPQPHANHNGGHVAFGPDGMLYIGFGDGGDQDDPDGHGQRTDTLLGAILRIDAARSTAGQLAIPEDNPFVGVAGARAELWSIGLRNPWRFSFDPETGDLWIGDVGGSLWEEVDHAPAADGRGRGVNYGWQLREGTHDTGRRGDRSDLVDPVLELSHDDGYCSVIGGYVSRDPRIPELWGSYVFTDACRGEVHVATDGQVRVHEQIRTYGATTFATGPGGELYLAALTGDIIRIDPAG